MNQKSAPKRRKPPKKKLVENLPVLEEPEEISGADKLLETIKPHALTIALAVAAAFIGFAAIAFLIRGSFDQKARAWRDLNVSSTVAYRINDISGLKEVASNYPDSVAGMWASQMAADFQLRMGVQQLNEDRKAGLSLIQKATENYQIVLDAPPSAKTTMLQRRAQYGLAYACESLGEFDRANTLYSELVEAAPDSPFADPARRGMQRSSDPDYVALYKHFEEWEDVLGEAPGALLPGRPNIDFPSIDQPAVSTTPVDLTAPAVSTAPAETGTTEPATETSDDKTESNDPVAANPDSKTPESESSSENTPDATKKDDDKK